MKVEGSSVGGQCTNVDSRTATPAGTSEICAVVGPACDSFDKISLSVELPGDLEVGDLLLTENIGAYSTAASTKFNGFDGAKIVHLNFDASTP